MWDVISTSLISRFYINKNTISIMTSANPVCRIIMARNPNTNNKKDQVGNINKAKHMKKLRVGSASSPIFLKLHDS